MKKRMGFVSNSSSSSFAVIGVRVDKDDFEEIFGVPSYTEIEKLTGLEVEQTSRYSDEYYIGLSWAKLGEDETRSKFFARIKAALVPYMGKDVKVYPINGGWYNG